VIVLERASAGGGSSALCGGYIYLGGGTRVQKMNGFDDTVEDMYNYLVAMTPNPDLEKIRLYCEHSLEHFDWLERQGIVFNNGYYGQKHVEHPTEDGLAWTGNEKVWPFSEQARPFPRGHKVTIPGRPAGTRHGRPQDDDPADRAGREVGCPDRRRRQRQESHR